MSLVLFDIDGTLLRNAGAHHKAALAAGIRQVTGLSTTLDGVPTSGMLDRDLIEIMLLNAGADNQLIRSAMDDIVAACQFCYLNDCAPSLQDRLCPGVVPCLDALSQHGAGIGVVTGNLSAIGWKKLELAGIRDYFSVGAFAEDAQTRAALARLAASRASNSGRVSLIGDHRNDIDAAHANGFQSIAVATGLMPYEELQGAGPDVLVRDLTELNIARLLN